MYSTAPTELATATPRRMGSAGVAPMLTCSHCIITHVPNVNFAINALLAQNQIWGWTVVVQVKHGQSRSYKSPACKSKAKHISTTNPQSLRTSRQIRQLQFIPFSHNCTKSFLHVYLKNSPFISHQMTCFNLLMKTNNPLIHRFDYKYCKNKLWYLKNLERKGKFNANNITACNKIYALKFSKPETQEEVKK